MKKVFLIIGVFLCTLVLTFPVYSQTANPLLEEGVKQYQEENLEEAIETLTRARQADATSPMAAFVLGMAYKRTNDFSSAEKNLRDAISLKPSIKEAYVELIDVLYQQNKLEEAKSWIDSARKENILPAKIAFLEGLVLLKENKNMQAVSSFEQSKKLDPSFAQSADFQISMAYIKDGKLSKAKESLNLSITQNPVSDLAGYARQYQDIVDTAIKTHKPVRLTLSAFGGYDTNMISKPKDNAYGAGLDDEKALTLNSSARVDFTPRIEGPWLFNASYTLASLVNSKHTHSHDSLANSISVAPGYNFGRFAVNFNAGYTNYLLRTDESNTPAADSSPGYKKYLDFYSFGPSVRVLINESNILEFYAGYEKKDYDHQKYTGRDNVRDAEGLKAYLSWIWLYTPNGFFNLRAEYSDENADGAWWTNRGTRLTGNISIPLLPQSAADRFGLLSLQLTGGVFIQDYLYDQTYYDPKVGAASPPTRRRDVTYNGSIGLNWAFWKYASLICQVSATGVDSNIPYNAYSREIYMAGLEFRY